MGFEHVELTLGDDSLFFPAPSPNGLHYERWLRADGNEAEKLRLYETHLPPDPGAAQTWHSALPPAWHLTTWCGDRTIELLRKSADQPFMIWTSFADPHHPFDAPDPWSRMYDPADIDLPKFRERDLDKRPWWHTASLENTPQIEDPFLREIREKYSRMPVQTDVQLRHIIANYYGMISLIDHNVGRILTVLDEIGLAENTLVVYASDHGDWLGDHGLILKGPMMYEGLLRVGCIMRGPNIPSGQIIDEPVSTVDLLPTFLDICSVRSDNITHGKSLWPLIKRPTETRDFAYNEWDLHPSRCGVKLSLRTVRTRTHKLTLELLSGAGELYDLAEDPFEMENRFSDSAYRAVQRELTEMIHERPDDVMEPPPQPVGMA
jgi:arylsulfatase A-like enzyme